MTITCNPGQPDSKLQADTDSTGDPEHPSLHYNFKWSSGAAWACPQAHPSGDGGSGDSGGLSGGWIFIIVYVTLLPMAMWVLKVLIQVDLCCGALPCWGSALPEVQGTGGRDRADTPRAFLVFFARFGQGTRFTTASLLSTC